MIEPIWMCCACAAHHDPRGRYKLVWKNNQRVLGRCAHCRTPTQRQRLEGEAGGGGER